MAILFVFYRNGFIESICEDSESASKEEAYQATRPFPCFMATFFARDIDACWGVMNEFDDLGLRMHHGQFTVSEFNPLSVSGNRYA